MKFEINCVLNKLSRQFAYSSLPFIIPSETGLENYFLSKRKVNYDSIVNSWIKQKIGCSFIPKYLMDPYSDLGPILC